MRNRRELLVMTACAAASRSLAATPGRIRRIGWLTAQLAASLSPYLDALREGLVEQKLVPGESIEILYRYGDDRMERVPALARELVESGVELLIVQGAAIPDVLKLGLPVPIIFVTSADPISAGFAKSLSQPSGNCTGVTFMAFELLGKRLELLKEIIPKLNRVAVLGNPRHAGSDIERASSEEAGHRLGIAIDFIATPNSDEEIELCQMPAGMSPSVQVQPDLMHLAFEVDDLAAFAAELQHKGFVLSDGPTTTGSGSMIAFIDAPEGYEVELIQRAK